MISPKCVEKQALSVHAVCFVVHSATICVLQWVHNNLASSHDIVCDRGESINDSLSLYFIMRICQKASINEWLLMFWWTAWRQQISPTYAAVSREWRKQYAYHTTTTGQSNYPTHTGWPLGGQTANMTNSANSVSSTMWPKTWWWWWRNWYATCRP